MNLHVHTLLILIALIVMLILIGFIFAIRWNILLRRLEKTRNVGVLKNFNPFHLHSFMKSYTPNNDFEIKTFRSAQYSFKVALILFILAALVFISIMNFSKVIQ